MTPGDGRGRESDDDGETHPGGDPGPGGGTGASDDRDDRDDRAFLDPIGDDTAADGRDDPAVDLPASVAPLDGRLQPAIGADGRAPGDDGRYVRPLVGRVDRTDDVAVDASLRAAARRGSGDVRSADLRAKLRADRAPSIVVFAVDASASMRAHGHIATAERLTAAALRDTDRGRDYVAVVAFRDETADVVVPPTADPARAADCLSDLPTGNRTPLSAGLLAALRLVERERTAVPDLQAVVVAMTDGRPTVAIADDPVAEATALARRLGVADVDLLVLDLDRGTAGSDVCRDLAAAADGDHVVMGDRPPSERRRVVTRLLREFREGS